MTKAVSVRLHILMFCYIFSFYVSKFPASMVIVLPLFLFICADKKYLSAFLNVWGSPYIVRCFLAQLFVIAVATAFPLVFLTVDFSLVSLLITQTMHFVCASFFFAFLDYHKISFDEVCEVFVNIFVLQSFIECAAFINPNTLGAFVRKFNRFQDELVGPGAKVRGFALSAATTYHLSLIYGMAGIIYVKQLIDMKKIQLWAIIKGLAIFIGIFFAGRTGFVGVGIAGLYFIMSLKVSFPKKIVFLQKLSIIITVIIVFFLSFAPKNIRSLVTEQVIPYAFEFVYSKLDSGKAQTASTNRLKEMWSTDFDEMELVRGSGRYMDETGQHYYMRVDPGLLRHLLYGGIAFYAILILYQGFLTFPFVQRKSYYIFILCMIYFFIMDFKGVTIALNKFNFCASLMFGYSYTKNYKGNENER